MKTLENQTPPKTVPLQPQTPAPAAPPDSSLANLRRFWRQGEPMVWMTGATLTLTLIFTATLIAVVMLNGLGVFWPRPLALATLTDGSRLLGEITARQTSPDGQEKRLQFKVANRDLYGMDFRWVPENKIKTLIYPPQAAALERREYGNFQGTLAGLRVDGKALSGTDLWPQFEAARAGVMKASSQLDALRDRMAAFSQRQENLRLHVLRLQYHGAAAGDPRILALRDQARQLETRFNALNRQSTDRTAELRQSVAVFRDAAGKEKEIALLDIVRAWRPNQMSLAAKAGFYASKVWELLTAQPREANTEGGLAPAIFGTVMMVLLMSLFCIPLGVIAAVYLREYARDGLAVRLVRIAVNNLAGVPSIVYGIFGLGFFVYGLGGAIDRLFFPERLPSPTFGTGGLLWSSLTLALLTVPVVIVATEEALAAVPRGIREGSLALGATRFQTLVRILLPMASPGIMTGLILAMARAAGEVAPLMIVGVVKLAPKLPLDTQFPFIHLERKFMHLGFHIYDVGFQSPNVEAAKPMVFVTTLLLLAIVIVMSALAIVFRNAMRKKYTTGAF